MQTGDRTDSDSDVDDFYEGNRFELMGAVALKLAFDHLSTYIPRVLVTMLVEEAVASEEDGGNPSSQDHQLHWAAVAYRHKWHDSALWSALPRGSAEHH